MTTFEIFILLFYYLFSFGYTVKSMGIDEEDIVIGRVCIVIYSLLCGPIFFPLNFAFDVSGKMKGE